MSTNEATGCGPTETAGLGTGEAVRVMVGVGETAIAPELGATCG